MDGLISSDISLVFQRIISAKWQLAYSNGDNEIISFRSDGRVGYGSTDSRKCWQIVTISGFIFLEILSAKSMTYRFILSLDNTWHGCSNGMDMEMKRLPPEKVRPSQEVLKGKYFSENGERAHYDSRFYQGDINSGLRRKYLVNMLTAFIGLASDHGTRPILMHGGLIGWYWNKALLPWDSDIDICLLLTDLQKLPAGSTRYKFGSSEFLWEINPHSLNRKSENDHYNETEEKNKIDARMIDPLTGLFIDITALAETRPGYLSTKCPHHYRAKDLFPIRLDSFEGIPIYVPHNVEIILKENYGINAMTSDVSKIYKFDPIKKIWLKK